MIVEGSSTTHILYTLVVTLVRLHLSNVKAYTFKGILLLNVGPFFTSFSTNCFWKICEPRGSKNVTAPRAKFIMVLIVMRHHRGTLGRLDTEVFVLHVFYISEPKVSQSCKAFFSYIKVPHASPNICLLMQHATKPESFVWLKVNQCDRVV